MRQFLWIKQRPPNVNAENLTCIINMVVGLSRLLSKNPKKVLAKMAKKCSKSAQNLRIVLKKC